MSSKGGAALGMTVSSEGGAPSGTAEEGGAVLRMCSAFLGFGKMLGPSSWGCNEPASTSNLLLVRDVPTRWNMCCNSNEDQNLTTTDGPSASSFSVYLREKEGSRLIRSSRTTTPLSSQSVLYTSWESD